jgi:antitoxin component of MazEF toxin-antitoxin module
MGFQTKVQLIKRSKSEQWYINIPVSLAKSLELKKGEEVEWIVNDSREFVLERKCEIAHKNYRQQSKNKIKGTKSRNKSISVLK